jgi:hypothetical protein
MRLWKSGGDLHANFLQRQPCLDQLLCDPAMFSKS